ncbi:MAG: ABC transporter substrate-binding protein [Thermoanaerobaculia bacterium]
MAWNHRSPLFRDPKVRHALTLVINRRELHRVLNLPADLPVSDVFLTERQFRDGELPEPLPYDPEQAKRLLDESGWSDTGGDGLRYHDGKPFRFAALAPTAFQGLEQAAVYVQAQLRRVGIQMEVQHLDYDAAKQRVRAGELEAAFLMTRLGGQSRLALFDKDSPIGYQNPKVIALLNDAASSLDPDETDRIYGELRAIFQTELPVTLLYPATWSIVAHRRVRGLSSPWRADPVWYMEDLWLEDRSRQ